MRYQPEPLVLPGKNHGTEKSGECDYPSPPPLGYPKDVWGDLCMKFLCIPSISSGHGSNGLLHPVQRSPMMACAYEEAFDHQPSGACGAAP